MFHTYFFVFLLQLTWTHFQVSLEKTKCLVHIIYSNRDFIKIFLKYQGALCLKNLKIAFGAIEFKIAIEQRLIRF